MQYSGGLPSFFGRCFFLLFLAATPSRTATRMYRSGDCWLCAMRNVRSRLRLRPVFISVPIVDRTRATWIPIQLGGHSDRSLSRSRMNLLTSFAQKFLVVVFPGACVATKRHGSQAGGLISHQVVKKDGVRFGERHALLPWCVQNEAQHLNRTGSTGTF